MITTPHDLPIPLQRIGEPPGTGLLRVLRPYRVLDLTESAVLLLRRWLAQGMGPREIGMRDDLPRTAILRRQSRITETLGITDPQDWIPVLQALLDSRRFEPGSVLRAAAAIANLDGAPPIAAWSALLTELTPLVGAGDLAELRWHIACGGLGLGEGARTVLRLMAQGMATHTLAASLGRSPVWVEAAQREVALALEMGTVPAGPGWEGAVLAAARAHGVLPELFTGRDGMPDA